MKKLSVFILTFALFCLTAVLASAEREQTFRYIGDVDNNGSITAGDARTILRVSVKLDTLEEEDVFFADTDGVAGISSADARMALRASVKLEPLQLFLHTHTFKEEKLSMQDCSLNDLMVYTCTVCGYEENEMLPVSGHQWSDWLTVNGVHMRECSVCHKTDRGNCTSEKVTIVPAACTLPGSYKVVCPVCGDVRQPNVIEDALGHDLKTEQFGSCITPCYTVTTCSRCDYYYKSSETAPVGHDFAEVQGTVNQKSVCKNCKKDLLTCYNENVNRLKDAEQYSGTITAVTFTRTQSSCDDYDFGFLVNKTIASIMEQSVTPDKTTYNLPWENRVITGSIFPIIKEDKVSRITSDDVKNMEMSRVGSVDITSRLPDSYTVSVNEAEQVVDLSHYKNIKVGSADKITVEIVPEVATLVTEGTVTGGNTYRYTKNGKEVAAGTETALERFQGIHMADLCERFPVAESGNTNDTSVTMRLNAEKISTTGKADWYFDCVTGAPIACIYDVVINMDENVKMTAGVLLDGTFMMHNVMTYTYVYLFNDYFPSK